MSSDSLQEASLGMPSD